MKSSEHHIYNLNLSFAKSGEVKNIYNDCMIACHDVMSGGKRQSHAKPFQRNIMKFKAQSDKAMQNLFKGRSKFLSVGHNASPHIDKERRLQTLNTRQNIYI